MGSIDELRKVTGAKTVIHKLDSDIIKTGRNPKLHPTNMQGKLFGRFVGETIKNFNVYDPEIIIESEMSLQEFVIEGKIKETPGHTNGSISVVLDDGNIFVGDLIMGSMFGKGKPKFPMYADSVEKVRESINKVKALSPKMIYCGHGGPFSGDEVRMI
jgi:glyoxylase-like metal-dependent hydrolase (beta-lactamase superfamily II)